MFQEASNAKQRENKITSIKTVLKRKLVIYEINGNMLTHILVTSILRRELRVYA